MILEDMYICILYVCILIYSTRSCQKLPLPLFVQSREYDFKGTAILVPKIEIFLSTF